MILGDTCSRSCGFCSVKTGRGAPLETLASEPEQVAEAAAQLSLRYVVITSVNRDELPDGGAAHFALTIRAVRARLPESKIEVLTPDFKGDRAAIRTGQRRQQIDVARSQKVNPPREEIVRPDRYVR